MSGSKISLSLGGKRKAPPPTNGVKRPRAALHEEENDGVDYGMTETVSHFDREAGGAVDVSKKKEEEGPLVIPKMANRDWRESANKRKRQKSGIPDGGSGDGNAAQRMADVEAADAAKKPGFGLNLFQRQGSGETARENNGPVAEVQGNDEHQAEPEEPAKVKTDDELAMDALLGRTTTNKNLIIEAQDPMSEADAFHHDFVEAPEMATLDDYARIPVEDFGAAMLRGMGWKEGEGIGSQKGKKLPQQTTKLPERRANLLGIGAKEDAALAQEMGAWGKAAKHGKEIPIYNPVLLRDKKTGAMYTEAELQKKREEDERAKYDAEFERKEKERENRRRRDEEHDRRHARDRRPEKGRDRDDRRHRDRDRRKDEDRSDEEYHRRKEKERRRMRERDDRDSEYDRERSRRHKERGEGDRDRREDRRVEVRDRR